MNRRKFVGSVVALTGAKGAPAAQQNVPVRSAMLALEHQWGAQHYDEKEKEQLLEVWQKKLPFRWYGQMREQPVKVATFEKEFAARMQTKYALAVNSGTAALETAIAALGIGPGDEVIIPAWTWHSCATSVVRAGAPARVRRNRRVLQHRSRRHRAPHHAADQVHHGGAPARQPRRHGPDPGHRAEAQAQGAGGLRAVGGRQLQGQAPRLHRRHRHLQPPGEQDHLRGRGRLRGHQRSRAVRARLPLPRRRRTAHGCTRSCWARPSSTASWAPTSA